jgi:D-3-phosphoglycerate dehydrogenase
LILELLEWSGPRARPYREVIEAWRKSCPRLPVWEEANERGFIERHHSPGSDTGAGEGEPQMSQVTQMVERAAGERLLVQSCKTRLRL